MTFRSRFITAGLFLALTGSFLEVPALAQLPPGQGGGRGAGRGGGFTQSNDPRAQNRTYQFSDTESLPYCVFASSKVSKDKKNPLIVSLHGLGVGPGFMCQGKAIDLAEQGGYVLVAPMG